MSAPLENQFWKLRSKHGRDKLFASPELLLEAAYEFFQWCIDNPLMEAQQAKSYSKPYKDEKTGEIIFPSNTIELPKMRAFTMHGLCRYLNCNTDYFKQFKKSLGDDKQDFSPVITCIEEIIFEQKFTGAAAGFLNPNIIARDLGLIDKKENRIDFEKMSDEQLDEIINRLKGNDE